MSSFENGPGVPALRGVRFMWWITGNPLVVRSFVKGEARSRHGSVEDNSILEAFEEYVQAPPDRKAGYFEAFRAGSLAVLHAIDLSVPGPLTTRGAVSEVDVWDKTKERMLSDFTPLICAQNELSGRAAFIDTAYQAADRHQELDRVRRAFEDCFSDPGSRAVAANVVLGMGFVLYQWDRAWEATNEEVCRQVLENFDYDPSRLV